MLATNYSNQKTSPSDIHPEYTLKFNRNSPRKMIGFLFGIVRFHGHPTFGGCFSTKSMQNWAFPGLHVVLQMLQGKRLSTFTDSHGVVWLNEWFWCVSWVPKHCHPMFVTWGAVKKCLKPALGEPTLLKHHGYPQGPLQNPVGKSLAQFFAAMAGKIRRKRLILHKSRKEKIKKDRFVALGVDSAF